MTNDTDFEGRRVSEFIGRKATDPSGEITGGYIDAVGVMLLDVKEPGGCFLIGIPRTVIQWEGPVTELEKPFTS